MRVEDDAMGRAALGLILLLSLALRLWNVNFGLPDWYHPDEAVKAPIIVDIAKGLLDPRYFHHPSLLLYSSALAARVAQALGWELTAQNAVLAARVVIAATGTATVWLTFVLGRTVGSPAIGLLAALLLAVAPLHVVCSHYVKEDVLLAFWTTALLVAIVNVRERGSRSDYLKAGVLAGLAAGTKYPGVLGVPLLWIAHRHGVSARNRVRLWQALLACGAMFLVTTPFAVISLPRFLGGLGHEGAAILRGRAEIAVWPWEYLWTYHLRYGIIPGFGLLSAALSGAGAVLAWRSERAGQRLIAASVVVLYLIFETSPFKPPPNSDRYMIPLLPMLAVLAGVTAQRLVVISKALALAVFGVAAVMPLLRSIEIDRAMAADTRAAARNWLVDNACPSGRILLEGALSTHGVALPSYVPQLPEYCRATYVYSLPRAGNDVSHYEYVVATSFMYERFFRFRSAPPQRREFYEKLFAERPLVAEFKSPAGSFGFHNPRLRVYGPRAISVSSCAAASSPAEH